jgi:hypothetical protein
MDGTQGICFDSSTNNTGMESIHSHRRYYHHYYLVVVLSRLATTFEKKQKGLDDTSCSIVETQQYVLTNVQHSSPRSELTNFEQNAPRHEWGFTDFALCLQFGFNSLVPVFSYIMLHSLLILPFGVLVLTITKPRILVERYPPLLVAPPDKREGRIFTKGEVGKTILFFPDMASSFAPRKD